jgi:hypothetical protein
MAKLSQLARLEMLEKKLRPETFEILNPRFYERDDRSITEEEWEAMNQARIAAARKAGHNIIRIPNPRSFD